MLARGEADAMLAGPVGNFASHLRYIDGIIGLRPGIEEASTLHGLIFDRGALFLADTSVAYEPTPAQIRDTVCQAAAAVRGFGIEPKVALVSHSNFGSRDTPTTVCLRAALTLIRMAAPELEVDGEMQADVALSQALRDRTLPGSPLKGEANLLVLPTLDAANTAYNIVKAVTNAIAIGPILLGPALPAHIVNTSVTSRGIVNMSAIACVGAIQRAPAPAPRLMAEAAEAAALELSDVLIEEICAALTEGNATLAAGLATPLHPADLADLLEQLEIEERAPLIAALGPSFDPEAIAYLDEFVRREVIEALGPEAAGRVVAELESDDAVDILSGLDAAFQLQVLGALPSPERSAIEQGLAFPEDSAGRLMRRELVAVPDYWNAGQAIDYLRGHPDLPDEFYDIILVDPRFRPVAAVPLSNLLRSVRDTSLRAVEQKGLRTFTPETDQEEVGRAFRKYGLVSAPVVAADGRLLGVITVDDVVEVIEEEAEEDILKLGGVQEVDVLPARPHHAAPPAAVARGQPGLLLVGGAGHLGLCRRDRAGGGAGRADADGGSTRRQLGHPGAHGHGPVPGDARDYRPHRLAGGDEGADRRSAQRRRAPRRRLGPRPRVVRLGSVGAPVRRCHADQRRDRRPRRRPYPDRPLAHRPRPRRGLGRVPHHGHRLRRLLRLSGARGTGAAVSRNRALFLVS